MTAVGSFVAAFPLTARAQNLFDLGGAKNTEPVRSGKAELFRGWDGFLDGWFMLDMAIVLLVAVALAAVIAYHPLTRGKASSIEELEQPKTFTMYSMVGALLALAVQVSPAMGFVIFGIGGLLRFRTNVGEAKDTGRVILATIVGVCCGVKLFVPAVFATAFGWVLIWYLESQSIDRLLIKGLNRDAIPRAAEAYRQILTQSGCKILGEKKKVVKGQVAFVIKAPPQLDRERLEDHFETVLPPELRGSVDWEVS